MSMAASDIARTGVAATAPATTFVNPYAGHRMLSEREQEVLGEYARLASTIKRVTALSLNLSSSQRHDGLLTDLRILERKMGLVLTLFKASVWSLIQTHQDEMEEEEQQRQMQQSNNDVTTTEMDVTITDRDYAI